MSYKVEWQNFGKWTDSNDRYETIEKAEKRVKRMVKKGYKPHLIRIVKV